jgi:hypothetical protein
MCGIRPQSQRLLVDYMPFMIVTIHAPDTDREPVTGPGRVRASAPWMLGSLASTVPGVGPLPGRKGEAPVVCRPRLFDRPQEEFRDTQIIFGTIQPLGFGPAPAAPVGGGKPQGSRIARTNRRRRLAYGRW